MSMRKKIYNQHLNPTLNISISFHSFIQQILCSDDSFVPGTVLAAEDPEINKQLNIPAIIEFTLNSKYLHFKIR